MEIYTLIQFIFDLPVYPSKVLLALYINSISSHRELSEFTKISRGKTYQTTKYLKDRGLIDTSERGVVKLNVPLFEEKMKKGIEELIAIAENLSLLKIKAIHEEKESVLERLKELERLESETKMKV